MHFRKYQKTAGEELSDCGKCYQTVRLSDYATANLRVYFGEARIAFTSKLLAKFTRC